jgi:toxin ParE1/3/4
LAKPGSATLARERPAGSTSSTETSRALSRRLDDFEDFQSLFAQWKGDFRQMSRGEFRFDWPCDNPQLWKHRPDITEGLYSYPQQSHVIYFRAYGDPPGLIEIVRVLHGRMEPARHI